MWSSRLVTVIEKPITQTIPEDMTWMEKAQGEVGLLEKEKNWLQFSIELLPRHHTG